VEYYGLDHLGSVRVVFDASGNILGRSDFGPFGQLLLSTGSGKNVYAQLFKDTETDLNSAVARHQSTRTGRFTTPDPKWGNQANPQQWNRYAYAGNDPIDYVDPSGLSESKISNCTTTEKAVEGGTEVTVNCTPQTNGSPA